MAASSRFATVSEDDFALKCFFSLFFEIITCVFILKQLFASGSVIIGEYSPRLRLGEYSPIITEPEANNCQIIGHPGIAQGTGVSFKFEPIDKLTSSHER